MNKKILAVLAVLIAFLAAFSAAVAVNAKPERVGEVYTIDNSVSNSVLRFDRGPDGSLTASGTFSTGGMGTGTALHSQGAVVLSEDGKWLLVVDAGSNQITVFQVKYDTLVFTDIEGSHGTTPISLAINDNLVYVLNSGGTPNIAGFWLSRTGMLTYLSGSNEPLSGIASNSPEQIGFNPEGNVLAVTEEGSNKIDTYTIDDGVASAPMTTTSSGSGPYGFAFNSKGYLIVSEAGTESASSYAVSHSGTLTTLSGAISNGPSGTPCWVAITGNGKIAYTANGGVGTISIYAISHKGMISLSGSVAASVPAPALDLALTRGSEFLYVLNGGAGITGFEVHSDGSLSKVTTISGLPASTTGLAAT